MLANVTFEKAKLEVISELAKLEQTKPNAILIGEISGYLKALQWQQIFKKEDK